MALPRFHTLCVKSVEPETAQAVKITLAIPPDLRDTFAFSAGQFLTLKANIAGELFRRSYSICSSTQRLDAQQELSVGIKAVAGGVFSNWAVTQLLPGDEIDVMPPDGRFTLRETEGIHSLGIAAGSGITPILSIISTALARDVSARFTLLYGNQSSSSVMFGEALQDLKDRYPARFSLVHVFSRQHQESALFNGRLDAAKLAALLRSVVDMASVRQAYVCGPEGLIADAERSLRAAGLAAENIQSERFVSASNALDESKFIANNHGGNWTNGQKQGENAVFAASDEPVSLPEQKTIQLALTLDGKTHILAMAPTDKVLDVALAAGLDLPYSCKGGVCCTCRAKITSGSAAMDKNFTLEAWEIQKGFVLTCQAKPTSAVLALSFDER